MVTVRAATCREQRTTLETFLILCVQIHLGLSLRTSSHINHYKCQNVSSPDRITGTEMKVRNKISSLKFLFWGPRIVANLNFWSLYPPGQAWMGICKAWKIFRLLIPHIWAVFCRLICPLAHLSGSSFSMQKREEDARICLWGQWKGAGMWIYCTVSGKKKDSRWRILFLELKFLPLSRLPP